MKSQSQAIYSGDTPLKLTEKEIQGEFVTLNGEAFYMIRNYDAMEPFFVSIVSSSDHWLFIASTGGMTAGRGSADQAIFPYYTVDKITENNENSGHKAILMIEQAQRVSIWEPFSDRQDGSYQIERNLYKNDSGTTLLFEEINHDLQLGYRYAWRTSEKFGFVKTSRVINIGDSACQVDLLDGIQNILPANVANVTQNTFSSLLDAYKRGELEPESGLGIFALSSTLTDLAEPSESLLATTAAQIGLHAPGYLLSSTQLDRFRAGKPIQPETDIRGRRGAYFVHSTLSLDPGDERSWHFMFDVSQDAAAVAQKIHWLNGDPAGLVQELEADIATGQLKLWEIVASADGIQLSNNQLFAAHHFANVLFNVMRGGIFTDQYWVQASDFIDFVTIRNRPILHSHADFFASLPSRILITDLQARAEATGSADLVRLSFAYLPLTFSRRHGDPSRPWNRFAINIKQPDGSQKLDYEGNWRDIFQNWEALAYSYPQFIESMISTFLNATTVDGYNPYRITHHGIDWEVPEHNNPWANIGYWSDHQIIYLQKLLEISDDFHPGKLHELMARPVFSYANVPYQIKPYADLLLNPYNTIDFNWELERKIDQRVNEIGTDGKLVFDSRGQLQRASLTEKVLTLLLAKLANFVPEGGIWMNTQRPEWNDANNALVGKGISVVTLCYLRRFVSFCHNLFLKSGLDTIPLSEEVASFFKQTAKILNQFKPALQTSFSDEMRRSMMDELGEAGTAYRWNYYTNGFTGEVNDTPLTEITEFLALVQQYVDHSLSANRRADHLYHSYNILHLDKNNARIGNLYEMLEGQVAILSSGMLSADESLALLDSLRNSSLYQPEQHSYILYPDRQLPGFLHKNCLTLDQVSRVMLFAALAADQDRTLITRDVNGVYHFSGHIHNFKDVDRALVELKKDPQYAALVEAEYEKIKALFEDTFHHDEFTGRSGSFFAYEGLGSIYWHMVAKLLLAAQEAAARFKDEPSASSLVERYFDIRQGLGFNKTPASYGAFPTDPYSHTPKGQGAKQPGMTGLVKEEILTRQAELGYKVENSQLVFDLSLLDPRELLPAPALFPYMDVNGQQQNIQLPAGSLAYTICQTPIILLANKVTQITVYYQDETQQQISGNSLDSTNSQHIFLRDGMVHHLLLS